MPFVTKKPSHYLSALEEESTEPLHIGLFLAGSSDEKRTDEFRTLGRAIRQSSRSIRCLWLRFKAGDDSLLQAFSAFAQELIGTKGILSLVFEGKAGTAQVQCLSDYLTNQSCDLRGIQFRRTNVDQSTFTMLRTFFTHTKSLKVVDMSQNPGVGDECIVTLLDSLQDEGGCCLETLNLGENNLDGPPDESRRISDDAVAFIAKFVSNTPTLSSITLRLRHLDDIGLGEIALVVRKGDCSLRRLDLSGNFGNSGIKIFAEALKTNTSLRTVSFGCHKAVDNIGGKVLLNVVDPFSIPADPRTEWENVKRSNHTLQSIFIYDRPNVTVDRSIITKLQSISTVGPHQTFQDKCWRHTEKNIDDISHLGLEAKHMPDVLSFVHNRGNISHLFHLIRSQHTPELCTNPSPEKARISHQMDRIEQENEILKGLLDHERERSGRLHEDNSYLRNLILNKEEAKKCCLMPIFKMVEMWQMFMDLLREPPLYEEHRI